MRAHHPTFAPFARRSAPTAARRLSVAALVGLFVVGQLGSALHAATEIHAVCPEHGELVHLDGHDGAGHAEVPADAVTAMPVAGLEHVHDTCLLCLSERAAVDLDRPVTLRWRALLVRRAQAPPAGVEAARGIPVYLLAPKHSPPV